MTIDADTLRAMIAEDTHGLLELPAKPRAITADERLAASFDEITEFVRARGREPAPDSSKVAELKLHARLQALRDSDEARETLADRDTFALLAEPTAPTSIEEAAADDPLGLLDAGAEDIFALRHVPKKQTMPERVARRRPCEDFERFEPLFKACQNELRQGQRKLLEFRNPSQIRVGRFYVLNGVLLYVDAMGERSVDAIKKANARLRCIFENGTESDLLLQSLASNLYKEGKRVTEPEAQSLRAMGLAPDTPMATVYVLRSRSSDPQVVNLPELHKIGSTRQPVAKRLVGASESTTFLGAPVELIAEYHVPVGAEKKLEALLHRIFADVRLDAWFEKRGGGIAEAREWFAVPLSAIEEALTLIENESITAYEYDADRETFRLKSS